MDYFSKLRGPTQKYYSILCGIVWMKSYLDFGIISNLTVEFYHHGYFLTGELTILKNKIIENYELQQFLYIFLFFIYYNIVNSTLNNIINSHRKLIFRNKL